MTTLPIRNSIADTMIAAASHEEQYGKLQWLLAFIFLILLFGNNVFKKPMLAVIVLLYFPFAITYLQQSIILMVRSYSFMALWALFVSSYYWSFLPKISLDLILTQSAFIALAILVTIRYQKAGFAKPLRFAALLLLSLVVLYSLVFPGSSFSAAGMTGFYSHKNIFGSMVAVVALILFHAPGRSTWHIGLGLVAVGLAIASQSKTAITLIVVCSVLLPLASWWGKNFYPVSQHLLMKDIVRLIIFSMALASLIVLVIFREQLLDLLWAYLPKETFTGRGTLWLVVIQQIHGNTLLGIGPGVFWQAKGASEIAQTTLYQMNPYWIQRMVSADGSYIDLLASIGMLGLALFLLTAVDLYRHLFRNWHQPDSRLIFVLATFVLLHAITESTILYSTNILWFIYLLCYFRVVFYAKLDRPLLQKDRWG